MHTHQGEPEYVKQMVRIVTSNHETDVFFCMCLSKTHILLDGVGVVEAKHPLTDDHGLQLDTTSLEKMLHIKDHNLMAICVHLKK